MQPGGACTDDLGCCDGSYCDLTQKKCQSGKRPGALPTPAPSSAPLPTPAPRPISNAGPGGPTGFLDRLDRDRVLPDEGAEKERADGLDLKVTTSSDEKWKACRQYGQVVDQNDPNQSCCAGLKPLLGTFNLYKCQPV